MSGSEQPPLPRPTKVEFEAAKEATEAQRYDRGQSEGAPEWALWKLHGELVASARLYETGEIENQRDAVAESLLSVHRYLKSRGFALAALAPLMRPVAALVERENRSIDLLFAERKAGGRPKATMTEMQRTGVLASLASFWLDWHSEDSRRQEAKLREAVRTMKGPWFGKISAANLKTARDLVMQEAKDHPSVLEFHRFNEVSVSSARLMFGDAAAWTVLIQFLNDLGLTNSVMTRIQKTPPVSLNEDE